MSVRAHSGLAILGIKVASRYRWEVIAAVAATPVALIIFYNLWSSIFTYTGQTVIKGFTFSEMIDYYVLSMIVGFFTWSEADKWMEHDVVQGKLVSGMIRPLSIIPWYLSFEAGMNAYNIITQMLPVFIIGFVFFKLPLASMPYLIAFFFSLVLAFLLYFGLAFLLGLASFWMKRITGLRRIRRTVIAFFGGSFIPISFFPIWLQKISPFLPFEYIRSVPILIYQQRIPILSSLLLQIVWVIVIYLILNFVTKKAMRRYSSVGL